jgi:hypothetical protein
LPGGLIVGPASVADAIARPPEPVVAVMTELAPPVLVWLAFDAAAPVMSPGAPAPPLALRRAESAADEHPDNAITQSAATSTELAARSTRCLRMHPMTRSCCRRADVASQGRRDRIRIREDTRATCSR